MNRWDTMGMLLGAALVLMLMVIFGFCWWNWSKKIKALVKYLWDRRHYCRCRCRYKRKKTKDDLPRWQTPAELPTRPRNTAYDDSISTFALDRGATRRESIPSQPTTYFPWNFNYDSRPTHGRGDVEAHESYSNRTSDRFGTIRSFFSIENEAESDTSSTNYGTVSPSKRASTTQKDRSQLRKPQIEPLKVNGYFMKKHVFLMKDLPQDTNRCQFAYEKASNAYAENCLPRTYTMIFVRDKMVFKDEIGREAAIKTMNYAKDFTTNQSFYTMTFKLLRDNESYLFKEKGLRQLSLTCNGKRQIEHLNKCVEPLAYG
ncbi:uncharacterized protein LOC135490623 [Lineus longissimus]|uniref:uncharacterized protein LOC135490623 n=1 Tax=Lineus longissimus TaxID=88925 RepID=UPI002B4E7214